MMRIWALATNTFREAVRDRVLYSILFFAVGIIGLSLVLDDITVGDQEKVVRSVAQGAIDIFGAIIAMFLGVSLVWKAFSAPGATSTRGESLGNMRSSGRECL